MFIKEKKIKRKNLKSLLQRDFEFYDKISHHLIAVDNNREVKDNLIGTDRLLRGNSARLYKGFYTEQKFDTSNLRKIFSSKNILELSRSCVHLEYRSGIILKLLWKGILKYIKIYKIKVLIECASSYGINPDKFKDRFSLLHDSFSLTRNYDYKSLQNNNVSFTKKIDNNNTLNKLPPLIKSYLKAGGKVSKKLFIDTKFEAIDYCGITITDKIVSCYQNKF